MTLGNSRPVSSNQQGLHEKLPETVQKHLRSRSQRPIAAHTLKAFEQAQAWLSHFNGPLILDSCCGVGESTKVLAQHHPQARVIGLDKSAARLLKHRQKDTNYLLLQADVRDFWRLARNAYWQPQAHYLLYPNPYPKSSQLNKRWHGSDAFPDLLALGGHLTVRSNWQLYIEEFSQALKIAGFTGRQEEYVAASPMTAFERKYWASGQQSWQLTAQL